MKFNKSIYPHRNFVCPYCNKIFEKEFYYKWHLENGGLNNGCRAISECFRCLKIKKYGQYGYIECPCNNHSICHSCLALLDKKVYDIVQLSNHFLRNIFSKNVCIKIVKKMNAHKSEIREGLLRNGFYKICN